MTASKTTTTTTSATRKPRQSRASRGAAAAAKDQARLHAVPDQPQTKPAPSETPKPQPKTQPKPKKPVLGKSGYRAKYGVSDAEIIAGIRAELGDEIKGMSDGQILAVIGWALTVKSAVAKVRASKSA